MVILHNLGRLLHEQKKVVLALVAYHFSNIVELHFWCILTTSSFGNII